MNVPDMATLANLTWEELRQLQIAWVGWYGIETVGFRLNDGQSCKAGAEQFGYSYNFDPNKKITRIESIVDMDEKWIIRMNFYHHEEILVEVGFWDDYIEAHGGRIENFEIADDEQLFGCELYYNKEWFRGVSWLKIKLI